MLRNALITSVVGSFERITAGDALLPRLDRDIIIPLQTDRGILTFRKVFFKFGNLNLNLPISRNSAFKNRPVVAPTSHWGTDENDGEIGLGGVFHLLIITSY